MTTEQTQHARDSAELRRLCSERDALREKVAEQAREIERIDAGAKKIATYAVSLEQELAAMKAQPSRVVRWPEADEIMQMAFEEGQPSEDASGYYFELEEFDLFIQRLMEEVARLNSSPVSAGEPVPATIGLTEYTYREALKTLREVLDPDDWMGEISIHAFIDAALSAPSHGEQVREGWRLVPFEPTPEMLQAALDKPCFDPLGDLLPWSHITRTSYAAMLAAAPSAGSQEQGE